MDEKYKKLENLLREILGECKYSYEEDELIEFIDNILYEVEVEKDEL